MPVTFIEGEMKELNVALQHSFQLLIEEPWTNPTDWYINTESLAYLDSWMFVSEPTCLAVPEEQSKYYEWTWVSLKEPVGLCIPNGLLSTYIWIPEEATNGAILWFRGQDLPPDSKWMVLPTNCYYIHTFCNIARLRRRVNGVDILLQSYNYSPMLPKRTWIRLAVFWKSVDILGQRKLAISWQVNRGDKWENLFTAYDTENLWERSEVNRIGLEIAGANTGAGSESRRGRFDDTEIWR